MASTSPSAATSRTADPRQAASAYADGLRDIGASVGAREVLAALAGLLAIRDGLTPSPIGVLADPSSALDLPEPPIGLGAAELLGLAHERLVGQAERRSRGVFYTPEGVASRLLVAAVEGWTRPRGTVQICDPACGGGAFLLAAARWLEAEGVSRAGAVDEHLAGLDLDPLAVDVARSALALWAAETGEAVTGERVVVGDALDGGAGVWLEDVAGFDLVVGNPPFGSPLGEDTALDGTTRERLRRRLGDRLVRGYTDVAALFLACSLDLVVAGGRVALIVPESILAARDAGPTRRRVLERGALVGLWTAEAPVFDASVRVCAPVIEVGVESGGRVARWRGVEVMEVGALEAPAPADPTWGALLADRFGAPPVALVGERTLGSLVTATAGFREQFYGLAPYVYDDPDGPPAGALADRPELMTSGLIDPVHSRWGRASTQFARRRWLAPRIELDALGHADAALARWADARLVPKVVLATQTRVLEAAVDELGTWWPSVPVVAVTAAVDDLWLVAAVLQAPPVTVWAARRAAGTALSADSMKLSARQVLDVPLPARQQRWDEAAAMLREAAQAASAGEAERWRELLEAAGQAMCEAYRVGPEVARWWADRLPAFRG